ncbi:hypothetical protein [Myceligenerans indicum]|uniref:Uncharacterized protein n=1 Tax=Myceligenerans indicum TaxID=2593663 RepID=A0ABS1LF20_9MICO|nr:hypothetical protein [Myceligenerans indicum]MBL0884794.1 hypothetical protein [Myceligenerans indicum]
MDQNGNAQYGQLSPQPAFTPNATLRFTVQGNVMTSNMVPPLLTIDGHKAPSRMSGSVDIPIESGRHHLEASSQWLRRYGQAAFDLDIAPGQAIEVFYAPPLHQFTSGAMGLSPQKRKGAGLTWGILGGLGLVVVLLVAAAFVA